MKKIFVLTGEPSGDKLASEVISQLKTKISQNYDDRKAINAFATDAVTRAISDSNELYKNALHLFFQV